MFFRNKDKITEVPKNQNKFACLLEKKFQGQVNVSKVEDMVHITFLNNFVLSEGQIDPYNKLISFLTKHGSSELKGQYDRVFTLDEDQYNQVILDLGFEEAAKPHEGPIYK